MVVLVLGHPNSGKTTVFNVLTGLRHKTVNYPGSTVEINVGTLKLPSQKITLLDSPGLRSLIPKSQDEKITIDCLWNLEPVLGAAEKSRPDLVLVIAEQNRLYQQLPILKQLQYLKIPCLLGISKIDTKAMQYCDFNRWSDELGVPVVAFSAKSKLGLDRLKQEIDGLLLEPGSFLINEKLAIPQTVVTDSFKEIETMLDGLGFSADRQLAKFDFDRWLLHPIFGFLVFSVVMSGLFFLIFSVASPFADLIDLGFLHLIGFIKTQLPFLMFSDFLADGLLAGIAAVAVFIPQIFLLFFTLGVLESSGYLARGGILVDRPLSMIGLNGKSFVPLLSGCACAIPAMLAARNIPQKKVRLLTIFVIPLMTCSARLPVYGLLLMLLFGNHALKIGLAMTALYFSSIVLTSIVAAIAGRIMGVKQQASSFQMELPELHQPPL